MARRSDGVRQRWIVAMKDVERTRPPRGPTAERRARVLELLKRARSDPGEPLTVEARQSFEPRIGDLSGVRVHVGPASARAASALDTRAYTEGRDIHLGASAPRAGVAGSELLLHELAHAAQAQPGQNEAPVLVAGDNDPAERDAEQVVERGTRPVARAQARIHRFPNRRGLTDAESVPPALVMQVVGDRFLVGLEVAVGTGIERNVELAVRALGTASVSADGLENRSIRIAAGTVKRPVAARIIHLLHNEVTIDLHGDGSEIVRLADGPWPDARNRGRNHRFIAFRNDRRSGEVTVHVELPALPMQAAGEPLSAGSHARGVSEILTLGGDAFEVSVRRFAGRDLAMNIAPSPYQEQDNLRTWVIANAAPAGDVTLAPLATEGRYLDFDLTGDGALDLRIDHRMLDWTSRSESGRSHWFDPFGASGARVGLRSYVRIQNTPDQEARPPIPANQRTPESIDERPGALIPLDAVEPLPWDVPGEAPTPLRLSDGGYSLQVDADGDRRKELLLVFRPRQECRADGLQEIDLDVVQLATRERDRITFPVTPDQRDALRPEMARAADGNSPAIIDIVPRFRGRVVTDPLPLALWPPRQQHGRRAHDIDIGNLQYEISLPFAPSSGPELVQDVSEPHQVGGFWTTDVVFGEYGDRFRFTLEAASQRDLLGISALERDARGNTIVAETRVVRLVDGAAANIPEHVSSAPQQFSLQLGTGYVHVRDALLSRPGRDPHTTRTHTLSVFGTAALGFRQIQFEFSRDVLRGIGLDARVSMFMLPVNPAARRVRDAIYGQGNLLAPSLRSALDQGWLTDAVYEAWRDAHVAMMWLQQDAAREADGHPAPQLPLFMVRAERLLLALRDAGPSIGALSSIPGIIGFIRGRTWGNDQHPYRGHGAFGKYVGLVVAWDDAVRRRSGVQTDARDIAAAAAAVDTLRGQSHDRATMEGLTLQFDGAVAAQVVSAHGDGLLGDSLYNAWDRLRRTMPILSALAAAEADRQECLPDGGRIEQAATDAEILQRELHSAIERAGREADVSGFTGERRDDSHDMARAVQPTWLAGHGRLVAQSLRAHEWIVAFSKYDLLMRGLDQWVMDRIRDHYGARSEQYRNNQYVHRMRERIGARANRPGARPVAGTFAPDSRYRGVSGGITAVPLTLIVFREGGSWHLHDLTPDRPYECSVADRGEEHPPHALFAELNDNDRFPKGILYYQVPGGPGGRIRCTAEKEWHEWARDIGLGLALIGLTLATAGTGTVAVAGAWFLAGAAVVNAVAAAGELHDTVTSGQATSTSVVLNILDIVASLAGAGALISGTVVRSATTAAQAGMAWTGAAARVAAFADRVYIPLTATGMAGDVATVAVMSYDAKRQLDALEESGATAEQISSARKGLLLQLAVTGGLTALSVKGDLPELRVGRRNIVLDVVGDVAIARAAGVRLQGVDLELPADSVRSHAAARWHARDVEHGRVDLGDNTDDFHSWHRRWVEMPERFHVDADGNYQVRMPTGPDGAPPPDSVQRRLRTLAGPDSAVVNVDRGLAIGDDVAALERAGARVDPLDPDWPATRRQLVDRLGGGRDGEAMVRRFESARLGASGNVDAYVAQRRQANRLLHDTELERIGGLFPGQQVYVTGAPARTGADIGRDIDRVHVDVVAPPGTTADQMAAMEQRGELIRLRPDPAYLQAHGLDADHTIALEVRVVPPDAFVGLAATGGPLLRIDNPLATRRVELSAMLDRHLGARSVAAPQYRVEVLSPEDFTRRFGSEARGRSVFQLEDGGPVIYARPDASPADMLDEVSHLAQLGDAQMARRIRTLDAINLHDWQTASVQHRLEMFQTKLTVELDAKERTLAALRAEGDAGAPDIAEATRQRDQLLALQREIAGITPRQLSQLNAGAIALPSYLEQPPWLYGRRSVVEGLRPNRFRVDASASRTVLPTTGSGRSSARSREGVRRVRRVGNSWTERTIVFSDFDGRVVDITTTDSGARIVTVERPASAGGARFTYTVEAGAELRVRRGRSVKAGQSLAEETREYRLVELEYGPGRTDLREEIRMRDESLGWRQRGSESTFRGQLMERAARTQIEAGLAARVRSGQLTHSLRIPHSRGGGGFDHVFVEFIGTGADTRATIRIIEVKDYPGRSVPLEDFSAIRGHGLEENRRQLRGEITEAADALRANRSVPGIYADLTADQLTALETAVMGNGVRVEIFVGPGTRIGAEGHHASTVLPALRTDVDAVLGPGSLVLSSSGTPTSVQPTHVTTATVAARANVLGTTR